MRRGAVVVLWFWICSLMLAAAADGSFSGVWQGTVHTNREDYRMVLHVAAGTAGYAGTLDSPDSGELGLRVDTLKVDGNAVAFEVKSDRIAFQGKVSADGSSLSGDWKENLGVIPVTFTRVAEAPDFQQDGSYLFQKNCAQCHAAFNATRAPWPSTLKAMQRSAILNALESGKMRAIGAGLTPEQRGAIANYLGRLDVAQSSVAVNPCPADAKAMANTPLWNGWGVDLANSRFQPAEAAGVTKEQIPRLKVKWAFGYAGGNPR